MGARTDPAAFSPDTIDPTIDPAIAVGPAPVHRAEQLQSEQLQTEQRHGRKKAMSPGPNVPGRSVRSRLTWIALLLLLPAWLLAGFSAWRLADAEREAVTRSGKDVARRVGVAIDRDIASLRAAMMALGTSPALRQGDLAAFHAQARSFARAEGLHVVVFDAEGRPLLTTRAETEQENLPLIEDDVWLRRAASTGRLVVSDLFTDSLSGRQLVVLILPVEEQPGAPLRYLLGFSTDAENYWSRLLEEMALPPGWIAAILDSQQRIAARYPEAARFLGRPVHPDALAAIEADGGPEGLQPGRDRDGKPIYVAWAASKEVPWRVLVGVPRGEIDRLIGHSALPVLGGGSLMVVALTLVTGWWGARRLVSPLAALEQAAATFGAGRTPDTGPPSGLREIDSVATALRAAAQERDAREAESNALSDRLAAVLDHVPVGVALAEAPSGRILLANERLAEIFRVPLVNEEGPSLAPFAAEEAYHPDGSPVAPEEYPLARALATGQPVSAEFRYRCGDGSLRWIHAWAAPMERDGAVVAFADAEAEHHAAEALQESERRFRTLADTVPQIVWSTRLDGVTDYINQRLAEYTGIPPEAASSATLAEIIHPEDRPHAMDAWARAVETGTRYNAELRMRRADGSYGWVVAHAVPVHGSDGTPIRWVGTSMDVNELVEARRALERQVAAEAAARQAALAAAEALAVSEDRFRRFAEASPDAIWITDPEGTRVEYLGPAFADIWGEPLDAAIAEPGLRLARVLEDDRPRLEQAMAEVQRGGVCDVQYRIRRADSEVRWIRDSIFAVRDGVGRVTRVGGLARDITDRREAEDRQALLLAELNHRVKNTLATVQSLALQTARAVSDATQPMSRFLGDFQGRLMALARGHDLLTARNWRGAPLADVASAALAPWLPSDRMGTGAEPPRVVLSGPGVWLAPRQTVALSLGLHELATNAAKHGALSVAPGRALLNWRLEADGMLVLDWTERYGPPAREPERTGFGTRLLKQGLPADLGAGARVEMWYQQEGFAAAIRFRPSDRGGEAT
jgi:PAS domain S-box-containing protein